MMTCGSAPTRLTPVHHAPGASANASDVAPGVDAAAQTGLSATDASQHAMPAKRDGGDAEPALFPLSQIREARSRSAIGGTEYYEHYDPDALAGLRTAFEGKALGPLLNASFAGEPLWRVMKLCAHTGIVFPGTPFQSLLEAQIALGQPRPAFTTLLKTGIRFDDLPASKLTQHCSLRGTHVAELRNQRIRIADTDLPSLLAAGVHMEQADVDKAKEIMRASSQLAPRGRGFLRRQACPNRTAPTPTPITAPAPTQLPPDPPAGLR